ncbi:MAG: hypothetical protein NC548_39480 [Lachnospiraceae bacterium]|nr:hypothetical protein [Lachnospiraceae bacterium]
MTLTNIFNVENKRTSQEELFELKFIKECKDSTDKRNGWIRAYNWSAYLYNHYILDENSIKPTHFKYNKDSSDFVSIGCPLKSIEKYLPNRKPKSINGDVVIFDISDIIKDANFDFNIDNYKDILTKWINEIPITTKKEKLNIKDDNLLNDNSIKSLIKYILSLEMIEISPIDALKKLSQIQNKLIKSIKIDDVQFT